MFRKVCLLLLPTIATALAFTQDTSAPTEIPVTTQWVLDGLKNQAQKDAVKSVVMLVCPKSRKKGTGFALSDGRMIATASHVVGPCTAEELKGTTALGKPVKFVQMVRDEDRDLALLCPKDSLAASLKLSEATPQLAIDVTTWGYPLNYQDPAPILSRGYVAGYTNHTRAGGAAVKRLIINGAFNPGNSGGPLIDNSNGKVVGVVVEKWTLFSPMAQTVILALNTSPTKSGSNLIRTDERGQPLKDANGNVVRLSNEEAIAGVLEEFYNVSQVMVGEAISVSELTSFLKDKGHELACH